MSVLIVQKAVLHALTTEQVLAVKSARKDTSWSVACVKWKPFALPVKPNTAITASIALRAVHNAPLMEPMSTV